jgi:D-alanyl-D-alanine carboxypeptidase (penicillin-binding protein 5/6)
VIRLVLACVLAFLLPSLPGMAQPAPDAAPAPAAPSQPIIPAPPAIAAKAWILMDADTGKVITEHAADERMAPASLTKMMTGYVLSEAIRTGKVKWEDTGRRTRHSSAPL